MIPAAMAMGLTASAKADQARDITGATATTARVRARLATPAGQAGLLAAREIAPATPAGDPARATIPATTAIALATRAMVPAAMAMGLTAPAKADQVRDITGATATTVRVRARLALLPEGRAAVPMVLEAPPAARGMVLAARAKDLGRVRRQLRRPRQWKRRRKQQGRERRRRKSRSGRRRRSLRRTRHWVRRRVSVRPGWHWPFAGTPLGAELRGKCGHRPIEGARCPLPFANAAKARAHGSATRL